MHTYTASQGAIWSSGRPSKQQSCRSGNLCDDDDLILKSQKNEQIKYGVDNNQYKHYIVAWKRSKHGGINIYDQTVNIGVSQLWEIAISKLFTWVNSYMVSRQIMLQNLEDA